jgi:hypothetical protein
MCSQNLLCCMLTMLCYARTAIAVLIQNTATYSCYPSYSIDTQANLTVVPNVPIRDQCAFRCTAAANCFAATYLLNGTCMMLQNCGHVVLKRNSTAYTFVKGNH